MQSCRGECCCLLFVSISIILSFCHYIHVHKGDIFLCFFGWGLGVGEMALQLKISYSQEKRPAKTN